MKDEYITITGLKYYYGVRPFKIGKKIKCTKESKNQFDSEAIKCTIKHVGKIGYVANSPWTTITGTKSAGGIRHKMKKEFMVQVVFITDHGVICKVVDGYKNSKVSEEQKDMSEKEGE